MSLWDLGCIVWLTGGPGGSMFSDESEEQQEGGSGVVRTSKDLENTVSKSSRASTLMLFPLDIQPENQDLWANAG